MKIHILVLNVKDADSIIIGLTKESKSLVILLDGGRHSDSPKVIKELNRFLKEYNKEAPDLIIGTHFDDDHIAGLEPVILHYGDKIPHVWMFNTLKLDPLIAQINNDKGDKETIFPSENDDLIGGQISREEREIEARLIQSVQKERTILQLLSTLKIPTEEPISGTCKLAEWAEISVIGPIQTYYDKLFPQHLKKDEFTREVLASVHDEEGGEFPCARFTKQSSPISRINLNSCIMLITVEDHKFLFTGDAGIDSFYAIPDYQCILKNIFWLKMPHHGSANNMNNALLDIMQPEHVVISGNTHISTELIACMESKGVDVKTTSQNGNIEFTYPLT